MIPLRFTHTTRILEVTNYYPVLKMGLRWARAALVAVAAKAKPLLGHMLEASFSLSESPQGPASSWRLGWELCCPLGIQGGGVPFQHAASQSPWV